MNPGTNRPRALFPPGYGVRAILGHLSFMLTRIVKHNNDEFFSALDPDTISEKLNDLLLDGIDYVSVSIDGSTHDSH